MQRVLKTPANGFTTSITPLFPVPSVPAALVPAGGCHLQAACLFSPVLEIAMPAQRNVWFSVSLMVLRTRAPFQPLICSFFFVFGQGLPALLWKSREASIPGVNGNRLFMRPSGSVCWAVTLVHEMSYTIATELCSECDSGEKTLSQAMTNPPVFLMQLKWQLISA